MYLYPCAHHMVEVIVSRPEIREAQHTKKGEAILMRLNCPWLLSIELSGKGNSS